VTQSEQWLPAELEF
jgi:hypothetical protein